jgi:hypothetical protein
VLAECDRVAGLLPLWRARFTWIAIVAVLSNALLPAAFAVGIGGADANSADRFGFCSATPTRNIPAKTKPALIVHHCALCAIAPDALPPGRQAAVTFLPVVVGEAFPPRPTTALRAPFRNYRTQARAPPATA